MASLLRYTGQLIAYSLFAAVIGYFASSPAYTYLKPDMAVIKLSFSHAGEHREACHRLTQEELNAIAPNMRRPTDCGRERISLLIDLELDGETILHELLPPSGLSGDGASTAYSKFPVRAGHHRIVARLRDRRETDGFDYEESAEVTLKPQQNFVIDFRPELGGFQFQ